MRLHVAELPKCPQDRSVAGANLPYIIQHLVVIAGPSASGKSAFVGEFLRGPIPEPLQARLRIAGEDWNRLEWAEFTSKRCAYEFSQIAGDKKNLFVVLEYDTLRKERLKGGFESDPTFNILDFADEITIVTLRSTPERLISQTLHRETGVRMNGIKATKTARRSGILVRFAAHALLPADLILRLKRAKFLKRALRPLNIRSVVQSKIGLFNQSSWLDEHYRQWQAYVSDLATKRVSLRHLELRPDVNGALRSYSSLSQTTVAPSATDLQSAGALAK